MKTLIVEDNPDMRDLVALRVQLTGYTPILASQGKEGVEEANAEKPDLILMDMMMPVMDGWEAQEHFVPVAQRKTYQLARPALFRSDDLNSCFGRGAVTAISSSV
jgi:CheY-like chemotaxis protein